MIRNARRVCNDMAAFEALAAQPVVWIMCYAIWPLWSRARQKRGLPCCKAALALTLAALLQCVDYIVLLAAGLRYHIVHLEAMVACRAKQSYMSVSCSVFFLSVHCVKVVCAGKVILVLRHLFSQLLTWQ